MNEMELMRRVIKYHTVATRLATVKKVHGSTISVQVGGSPKYIRNLSVIGSMNDVIVGDLVTLEWVEGLCLARSISPRLS